MKSTSISVLALTLAASTAAQADDLDYGIIKAQSVFHAPADLDQGGDLLWTTTTLQGFMGIPQEIAANWRLVSAAQYAYTAAEINHVDYDLHQFSAPLTAFWSQPGEAWSYNVRIDPSLSSDLESISAEDFFIGGRIGAGYSFTEQRRINFGLSYTHMSGDAQVLPFLGFDWAINDQWLARLNGPSLQLRWNPCSDWIVRFLTSPAGGVWNIESHGRSRDLAIQGYGIGVSIEKQFQQSWWLTLGFGYSIGNGYDINTTNNRLIAESDADSSSYLSLGARLGNW